MRKNNVIKLYLIYAIAILSPQISRAQLSKEDKLDSLKAKFIQDSAHIYRPREVSFMFALDSRNSVIHQGTKVPVNVKGFQLGFTIAQRHTVGLGFYSILTDQKKTVHASDTSTRTLDVNMKMGYATFFYELLLLDRKYIEIGLPFEIGSGNYQTTVTYTDTSGKVHRDPTFKDTLKRSIVLLGAGLTIDFKYKWIGFNIMGGYRLVAGNEPGKINFNGPFYSYGISIYFGEIIKSFKLHERRGSYIYNVNKLNNESP